MKSLAKRSLSLLLLLCLCLCLPSTASAMEDPDALALHRKLEDLRYDLAYGTLTESGSDIFSLIDDDRVSSPGADQFVAKPWVSHVVPASGKRAVDGLSAPDSGKVLCRIPVAASVMVLARDSSHSCVLVLGGKQVVWLDNQLLEDDYYGQKQPVRGDVRAQLESWQDVAQLHHGCGSIFALKKDGSTISLRLQESGIDISRWGKLSYLSATNMDVWGIGVDGQVYYYSSCFDYAASENYKVICYEDSTYTTYQDARLLKGFDLLSYDNGQFSNGLSIWNGQVFHLNDGCVTDALLLHGNLVCRDGGIGDWGLYMPVSQVDPSDASGDYIRYPLIASGQFDPDAGVRCSSQDFATMERKLLQNAVDVSYTYWGEDFSVLFADGSFLLCGWDLRPDNHNYDWRFLTQPFHAVDLIDQSGLVLDDGSVVCFNQSSEKGSAFKDWQNVSRYREGLGITRDGRLFTQVWDKVSESFSHDTASWNNVTDAIKVNFGKEFSESAVLGVTTDGQIRIAGELPNDDSSATAAADSSDPLPDIRIIDNGGANIYIVMLDGMKVSRAAVRFSASCEQVDFFGYGYKYGIFNFSQPLEDCVFLNIGASITPVDDHDNTDVVWSMMLREAGSAANWYLIDSVDTVPLEETTLAYISQTPYSWDAVTVIPTEAPNGHSPFYVGISVSNSAVGFSSMEAAHRFIESLFPEKPASFFPW